MKFRLLAAAAVSALLLSPLASAQTTAPAPAAAPPATAAPAPATRTAARPAAPTVAQFKTEAEAKAHCPADTVVWGNKETKVYHLAGTRYFGKTKTGAYMCRKEADAAKFHLTRARATTPSAAPTPTPVPAAPAPAAPAPAGSTPAAR